MTTPIIEKLYFSPVKSLSFSYSSKLIVKKNIGIMNDRIFAFTRLINQSKANNYEKNPKDRNLNFFLTLKNSPFLNKYNFDYKSNELSLLLDSKLIQKISLDKRDNFKILSQELIDREKITKYIPYLIHNINFPFFDTMPHNTISLINMSSIKDFEKKTNRKIEHERFRGNVYVKNIDPWIEFKWINQEISINGCLFKVLNKITRCVATNLIPNSETADINLLKMLRETYGHINMGIYLKPLNDGEINVENIIKQN